MATLQKAPLPRHGILSLKVDHSNNHHASNHGQDQAPHHATRQHHHGPLSLHLDMSVPAQKNVAIAHLITHHVRSTLAHKPSRTCLQR